MKSLLHAAAEHDMILEAHPVGAASAAMVFTDDPIANEFAPAL
jgi:hypothetical protein